MVLLSALLLQEVMAYSNVQTLLNNIGDASPLIEYNDPITYAEKYSDSFAGTTELFLVNWGLSSLITTKNDKWQISDEQALLNIMTDDSIIKSYLNNRPNQFMDIIETTTENISDAVDNELSNRANKIGKIDKWATSVLKDSMKITLRKSEAKMEILALIAHNTNDPNLKIACENCINTVFTNTITTIKDSIIKELISLGVNKAEATAAIKNQILMTPTRKMFKDCIYFLGECAKGISYALIILDVKDLLTFLTGTQSRADTYMNIVSYEEIYNGARLAYQKTVKQYKNGDTDQEATIETLFNIMLETRKNAYYDLPKIVSKKEWNQIISDNENATRLHYFTIKEITIKNYVKNVKSKAPKPSKIKNLKISANKQKEITLTWSKISSASGYQVYKSKSKSGKYEEIKTLKNSTTKYVDKISNGKTYYYKVRAYNKKGKNKTYGPFSDIKKGTEIGANWYKKVISSPKGSYKVRYQYDHTVHTKIIKKSDFPYYKVTDINKDGIKELILSTYIHTKYPDNRILILTYYKNKLKPLICFVGSGYRGKAYLKGKSIIFITGGSDFSYRVDFSIKSGSLKKIRDIRHTVDKRKHKYQVHYYINGKSVSQSLYNKYSITGLSEIKFK